MSSSAPAANGFAITPHDTNYLRADQLPIRAIYVAGTGNLVVSFDKLRTTVTLTSIPAGCIMPLAVTHVLATGTTATGLVALV